MAGELTPGEIARLARDTLALLREEGWIQYSSSQGNWGRVPIPAGLCLGDALARACNYRPGLSLEGRDPEARSRFLELSLAVSKAIMDLFPDFPQRNFFTYIYFNEAPGTSWADVELLLERMGAPETPVY